MATRNSETMYIEHTTRQLEPDELLCEECSAEFKIEHDMGMQYMPLFCVFCGHELLTEEERQIDYDEDEDIM